MQITIAHPNLDKIAKGILDKFPDDKPLADESSETIKLKKKICLSSLGEPGKDISNKHHILLISNMIMFGVRFVIRLGNASVQ
jgi:hypothetical protein